MKQKIKHIMICTVFLIFICIVPVKAETETAGSSLEKDNYTESTALYNESERRLSGKWIETDKGWTYQYDDGSYPKLSWRKIDNSWYYFNSKGYWIDDNTYEINTLKGIDVSEWQGNINWSAVKNEGIDFAFIRLGYNNKKLDKYYQKNIRSANTAGIPVGVYYYSKAVNEEEALRDARFVIENMKGYKVSYPVAIDMEDAVQSELGKTELGKIIRAFANEIKAAGYTPMVYTNENWYLNYIDWSLLGDIERWIANYSVRQNPNISRAVWQCCSTGLIDGVDGNVDINFGYKDYTKFIVPRTEPLDSYYKKDTWIKNEKGWWYSYASGGYPVNEWVLINNVWYHFDSEGYMQTGWQNFDGEWYYLNESGAMLTGWQYVGNYCYYLYPNGIMAHDTWIDDYYVDSSGAWIPGRYQERWVQSGTRWWYEYSDGGYAIGWKNINGIWYYFDQYGWMQTGWQYIEGKWYYLQSNGAMIGEGWHVIDNNWYYIYSNGVMASDTWIDGYYINSSGVWI